jgi:hypothetical protein
VAKKTTKAERKTVWTRIIEISSLVGVAIALVTSLPRISVSVSDPVDQSNPFSASFTIRNDSVIPLKDVRLFVGLGQIDPIGSSQIHHAIPTFESRFGIPQWQDSRSLGIDEQQTVTLDDLSKNNVVPIVFADIAVIVIYKPWFMPFHRVGIPAKVIGIPG